MIEVAEPTAPPRPNGTTRSTREIVAAVIALALTAMTIWDLLIMMGVLGSSDASFGRAKEVFQGLSGIFGTILGYYFGSMPTQAAQAEALRASLHAQRVARLARQGIQRALAEWSAEGQPPAMSRTTMIDELQRTLTTLENEP